MSEDPLELTETPRDDSRGNPAHGRRVTKNEMRAILGISPQTMDKLIAEGGPVEKRGTRTQKWELNTAAFIEWLRRRDVGLATGDADSASYDVAKRREKEASTRLKELSIGEREGKLIDIERVVEMIQKESANVRSRFLSVKSQVPGLTPEQTDALDLAIADALAGIASDQPETWNVPPNEAEADDPFALDDPGHDGEEG